MIDLYVDGISLRKIEVKHNEQLLILQNEKDETITLNVSETELLNIFRQVKMRCETLNLIPTAVVRPERHGRWIEEGDIQICSECGEEHSWQDYRASYCDTCGAKMDGKDV